MTTIWLVGIYFALLFNKKLIMAYTVNSCFEDFMRDSVNLDPERTATARASRDWLVLKIEDLAKSERIPPLYNGANHIFFGSFAIPLASVMFFFECNANR